MGSKGHSLKIWVPLVQTMGTLENKSSQVTFEKKIFVRLGTNVYV